MNKNLYAKIFKIVVGAVKDTEKMHPEYFAEVVRGRGGVRSSTRTSIAKRAAGQIASFFEDLSGDED